MNKHVKCPNASCVNHRTTNHYAINLNGTYFRKRDRRNIVQFYCPICGKTFSEATFEPTYRQKKPQINSRVRDHLMSGTSERRTAKLLEVDRKTIARRIPFLAGESYKACWAAVSRSPKRTHVQTDEMETFEHSKLKPLSIPLVVDAYSREILDIDVAVMPAKGLLAAASREKYGPRDDERVAVMTTMMQRLSAVVDPRVTVRSDMCPRYPSIIKKCLPEATHKTERSRRGCVVGYGELKAHGNDPLFTLNHSAAMVRDNIKRMARRTWCTTKRPQRLKEMLWIYVGYHNEVLLPAKVNATEAVAAA